MQTTTPLDNQNGMVLVISMIVLVLLTLIGMAALRTSTIEVQVSGNEMAYKRAFYNADAGIAYALAANPGVEPPWPSLTPTVDNELDTPDDAAFRLFYLRLLDNGPPKQIEVRSDSVGGRGQVSIIAGVQLPVPPGALLNPGEEGSYR